MQKLTSAKTFIRKKILGFYTGLLVLVVFCGYAEIQNRVSHVSGACSVENKDTKSSININDMLLLLNGLIIYDTENPARP